MKARTKIAAAVLFIGFYLLCLQVSTRPVSAQEQPSREGIEFFEKKITQGWASNELSANKKLPNTVRLGM